MTVEAVKNAFSRILSAKEAANYIGINERTMYRLANDGKIPCFKLGGKWVFDREMVTQWLTNQMINHCVK